MRIKSVILENFRKYKDKTVIDLGNFTAFIGKNDAGKSTVLEALDIFFENTTTKMTAGDACVIGERNNVRIGVVFDNLPDQLDIDAGAATTLQAEHLLNADGCLELYKTYDCTKSTMTPKVSACAVHPSADGANGLISKKNADLKKLVKEKEIEANCQQNNNPSMRQALYNHIGELELALQEVSLKDGDAKNIWDAIRRHLPVYALFRSDRSSSDQDPEVQDPMKLAIKAALAENASDLAELTQKVEAFAKETADRTLEQLKASFPDLDVATILKPQFRPPKWDSVFKLDLESDDSIPLNKRGSGIRRLVLLSFFQAEAQRKRVERAGNANGVPVVYAIEEPETSQHPDNQERIIQALGELSKSGDQVILTTHVPGLAGLLPTDSLRFVDHNTETNSAHVRTGSAEVLDIIAETLGVLPESSQNTEAKVSVAVEGPTDIDALISFGNTLCESGHIAGFDAEQVFWTIGGGETLKDWVERQYLDRIGLPQIFLFDSDRTSSELPPSPNKQRRVNEIEARENMRGFLSKKRTIENYVHADAVSRSSDNKIVLSPELDLDFGNVTQAFKAAFEAAKAHHGNALDFHPTNHEGMNLGLGTSETKCKKIITSHVMRQMTSEEIVERGRYEENGEEKNEILEWLTAICEHLVQIAEPRIGN